MIYISSGLLSLLLIALAITFASAVFLYNRLQLALLARKTRAVIEAQYERDRIELEKATSPSVEQSFLTGEVPSTQIQEEEDFKISFRPKLKTQTEQQSE